MCSVAGPVPWRMEIEEGIRSCSKFVCLVDRAWLTSYNCLQVRTSSLPVYLAL